jgi:hypothetical protein
MIPEIAMFWVISTALVLKELLRRGTNKKIRQHGFFDFIESAKASLILKCLELKFRLAFVLQKLRCFGFQRNGSLLCSLLYFGANLVN